jgi:hypothetical protein
MEGAILVHYHAVGSVRTFELFVPNTYHEYGLIFKVNNCNWKTFCMKFRRTKHRWRTARFASIRCVYNSGFKAVVGLRQLVAARTGSQTIHVGFVVNRVALGQVFFWVLRFSPVTIIPPMFRTHLFPHVTLIAMTNGRSLKTFQNQGAFDRKIFLFIFFSLRRVNDKLYLMETNCLKKVRKNVWV